MKNKSMLTKLILGFTLYLAIPLLIIGTVFFFYINNYSEKQIGASNLDKLRVVKNMNSMILDGIRENSLRLSINNAVADLDGIDSYKSSYSSTENLQKMTKAIDAINELFSTDKRLNSIYLYPDNSDFVITTNKGVRLKSEFDDDLWMDNYDRYKSGEANVLWTSPRVINDYSNNEYIISYIYPMTGYTSKLTGALVINIKETEFCKLINNGNDEGSVTIINSEGTILSSVNKSELGMSGKNISYIDEVIKSDSKEGSISTQIDGKRCLVTYYKSDFNNWTYINISSMNYSEKGVVSFKMFTICTLGILFLIGIITSIIVSKRIYHPVDRLVKRIKTQKGLCDKDNINEMSVLDNAFETLVKSENNMKKYIERNMKTLKEQNVLKLINGTTLDYDKDSIHFYYSCYQCVCLSIDKYSEFAKKHSIEERYYIKGLMANICEEELKKICICYCIDLDDDKLAVILNLNKDKKNEDLLLKSLRTLQTELSAVVETSVTVGIGSCFEDIKDISISYQQALNVLKTKLVSGYGQVISWKADFSEMNDYFYPYNEEKHIFSQLSLGNKDETRMAVEEFFDRIRTKSNQGLAIDNVIQIIHQVSANTIKYLFDSSINIDDVFGKNINIYEYINNAEVLDEVEEWFQELYSKIIEYCNDRKSEDSKHITKIIEYIDNNYQKDIGIEMIAENVGLSYSYARKVFKNETGKSIVDYLNIKRIERAKELLINTDDRVIDIAVQLGYNNSQSFNRFFKKYEGMTPSDFRQKKIEDSDVSV